MDPPRPPVITVTDTERLAPPLDECAHLENFVFGGGKREKDTPVLAPQDLVEEPRELSLEEGPGLPSPQSTGSTLRPDMKTTCQGCHCSPYETNKDRMSCLSSTSELPGLISTHFR